MRPETGEPSNLLLISIVLFILRAGGLMLAYFMAERIDKAGLPERCVAPGLRKAAVDDPPVDGV
jgi:hypothetical protein